MRWRRGTDRAGCAGATTTTATADAVGAAERASRPILAAELDRRLVAERHRRGRGIDRAADRLLWEAPIDELPEGTVVVHRGEPALVVEDRLHRFGFDGWGPPEVRPRRIRATVLTPPTSVTALAHGFRPTLHPSIRP